MSSLRSDTLTMRVTGVRITVFCSAIVIDVIVHCHTAGAFFESNGRKQLSLSSCGWVFDPFRPIIITRRHPEREEKNEFCGGRGKKKREILGGPAEGGPVEGWSGGRWSREVQTINNHNNHNHNNAKPRTSGAAKGRPLLVSLGVGHNRTTQTTTTTTTTKIGQNTPKH